MRVNVSQVAPTLPVDGGQAAASGSGQHGHAHHHPHNPQPHGGHLSALAQRELAQLAGFSSSMDLLQQILRPELRPGTPDAWSFLRGSTPTPADALSLMSSLGGGCDPGSAAASWLLGHGSPGAGGGAQAPQPAGAGAAEAEAAGAAAAAAEHAQEAGGAQAPEAAAVPPAAAEAGAGEVLAGGPGVEVAGGQPEAGPGLAAAAAAAALMAAAAGGPEQLQMLQQASLHARKLSDDFADASFNIELLLRSSTPVPR
jgi:hypothetical protein